MKILITGGLGFIGSNTAEMLINNNIEVVIFDNFSSGKIENIQDFEHKLQVIRGDIRDFYQINQAMNGIDAVMHLAAMASVQKSIDEPLLCNQINIDGTLNVLQAAKNNNVKRVVFASSAAIYGDNPQIPKREDMLPEPMSPYAISKITGEYYCKIFADLYNIQTLCFRYFNIYGQKQDPKSDYAAVVPIFINNALKQQNSVIYGDGQQTRDFVHIDDLAKANFLALTKEIEQKHLILNVANYKQTSITELFEIIYKSLKINFKAIYKEQRKGDIKYSFADNSNLFNFLNFKPEINLETGMKKTVNYYQKM